MTEKKSTVKFAAEVAKAFGEDDKNQGRELNNTTSILKNTKDEEPPVSSQVAEITYVTDEDDTLEPFYSQKLAV
jgi:hypothetical protein